MMRFRRFRVLFGQKARYFRKGVNLNFPLAALIVVIFEGTNDSWEPLSAEGSQVQRQPNVGSPYF